MRQTNNSYEALIQKLDAFIRKYYLNQVLKGLILALAFSLVLFLLVVVAEYQLYLSTTWRKFLFFGLLISSAIVWCRFVLLPLAKYFQLGSIISHSQAAAIIGEHFSEIQDRLLNVLQLKAQADSDAASDLVYASIDQKTVALQPIPFLSAIDLAANKRHLKYLLPPALVFAILLLASPQVLSDGSQRLLQNNQEFERQAPFQFVLLNEDLEVRSQDDLLLQLQIDGEVLPEACYINFDGRRLKMKSQDGQLYSYRLKRLKANTAIQFDASGFNSKQYDITVLQNPQIQQITTKVKHPRYTGEQEQLFNNKSSINVSEGSQVYWTIATSEVEDMEAILGDQPLDIQRNGEQQFLAEAKIQKAQSLQLITKGAQGKISDTTRYVIEVIQDQYPNISAEQQQDSVNSKLIYFVGEASDDYGLSRLQFHYAVERSDAQAQNDNKQEDIPFKPGKGSTFSHFIDVAQLQLAPGDKVSYYFQVWDNDGVNGAKSSKSARMQYLMPTLEEFDAITKQQSERLKKDLAEAIEESRKLKEASKELKDKLLEKKDQDWEDQQSMSDLQKQQEEFSKEVERLSKQYSEHMRTQEEFKNKDEELRAKQEQLEELFEEVMSPEMKELMQKMEELMQEMQKEDMMDNLEDFELSNEQLEKELDRMLELFEKLEFEQQMQEAVEDMEDLAQKQEQLKNEEGDSEDLKEKQDELNKKQEELEQKLEELAEKMEEMGMDNQEMEELLDDMQSAGDDMDDASEQLGQEQQEKAKDSQQKASDKLSKGASGLSAMMSSMQMEQMALDMEALRQLLENLVSLSFDQEQLQETLSETPVNSAKYVELVQRQHRIKDDSKTVEDSLYALAKRVVQIESFITTELTSINKHLEKSIDQLEERRQRKASVDQQYVMTGYNNLALMLSEVMEQMQQQMAQQMQGNQNCSKPGGSKPSGQIPSMTEMQKQLNKQLGDMQQMMQDGKKPNGMSSKEIAQSAARQAALRQALKELAEEEKEAGREELGDLDDLVNKMEQSEKDLVNKKIDEQFFQRQQEILTRLLEAEEADREREKDNKRESRSAQDITPNLPPSLKAYLAQREAEIINYKALPPALKPFYKQLVEDYFDKISSPN